MAISSEKSIVISGWQMLQCQIAGGQKIQMAKTGINRCFQLLKFLFF
jgi:hypothetical protein